MKHLLAVVLLAFSVSAFAGNNNNQNNSDNITNNYTSNVANAVGLGGTGGNATALGGSSNVDVRNTNLNSANSSVNSSNVQGQIQGQGQKQSTENSNNSTVTVSGDNFEARRIPVSTAFAPSIAPTANCALSVSGGVSVIGFSGSFGKAYIDENCAALEKIRNVALVLKDTDTAEALMCQDKAYAKARATAGRACPIEQE
jgi:hypothetical protein